jgi:hypothetical protein
MIRFTLGVADILHATGWGIFRVRALLNNPHHLTYAKRYGPKGGNATRLFRLSDILIRCRTKRAFTEEMALNLISADAAYREGHQS